MKFSGRTLIKAAPIRAGVFEEEAMRRLLSGLCRFCGRLALAVGLCLLVGSLVDGPHSPLSANQKKSKSKKKGKKKGQPVEEVAPEPAVEQAKVPKPPQNDFTVQVYQKMDEANLQTASFKDQLEIDQVNQDVEVVVTYYNWSLNNKDYWNRQISIDTKAPSGVTVEHISKSGFGDLGYVLEGNSVTSDVYRKEQVVIRGDVATARMVDMEIGDKERDRFRYLMTKFVLEK